MLILNLIHNLASGVLFNGISLCERFSVQPLGDRIQILFPFELVQVLYAIVMAEDRAVVGKGWRSFERIKQSSRRQRRKALLVLRNLDGGNRHETLVVLGAVMVVPFSRGRTCALRPSGHRLLCLRRAFLASFLGIRLCGRCSLGRCRGFLVSWLAQREHGGSEDDASGFHLLGVSEHITGSAVIPLVLSLQARLMV
jgi:hypothetical protein